MSDETLFMLILETCDQDEPLRCGHEHRPANKPYGCSVTRLDPEDSNMGDEAFIRAYEDAYL
jgi:hypothetical protein